jgi:trimeric autotransporter adhesin
MTTLFPWRRAMAAVATAFLLAPSIGSAAATAFTYQGRLNVGGNAANGAFEMRFELFDASWGGAPVAVALTNSVVVTNGLFDSQLDFGVDAFNGQPRWLAIGVREQGTYGEFEILEPRQPVTPAPMAIRALRASALDLAALRGGSNISVSVKNDTLTVSVNPTNLWGHSGNTVANNSFIGTLNDQPLVLKAAGQTVGTFQPLGVNVAPHIVLGHPQNQASGEMGAVVAGGGSSTFPNNAHARYTAIGGGEGNNTMRPFSAIGGGRFNFSEASHSVIAGGFDNDVYGDYGTVGGGEQNVADASHSTVGGGLGNIVREREAVIAGGERNTASGIGSAVGGGKNNSAAAGYSVVAGGLDNTNTSSGLHTAILGGARNRNSGITGSAILGGHDNLIQTGIGATILGGGSNVASAGYAVAGGFAARAEHWGSFVWNSDLWAVPFSSTGNNQFLINAHGGVGIGHNAPTAALHVRSGGGRPQLELTQTTVGDWARIRLGVSGGRAWDLSVGSGPNAWMHFYNGGADVMTIQPNGTVSAIAFNQTSDRNVKTGFTPVDAADVLARVLELPLHRWQYTNDPAVTHLGPTAQDFRAAFSLGSDERHISTIDADGVALAALQGLNRKLEEKLAERDRELEALRARLERIEQVLLHRP